MTCPRCNGSIETYSFQGRDASVCTRCGFVGVTVEHASEPVLLESWDEALQRFRAIATKNS